MILSLELYVVLSVQRAVCAGTPYSMHTALPTASLQYVSPCTLKSLCIILHSQANLVAAVEEFIADGAAPAERMIRDLVACEHSYINTDHPAFIGGSRAIAQVLRTSAQLMMVCNRLACASHVEC